MLETLFDNAVVTIATCSAKELQGGPEEALGRTMLVAVVESLALKVLLRICSLPVVAVAVVTVEGLIPVTPFR